MENNNENITYEFRDDSFSNENLCEIEKLLSDFEQINYINTITDNNRICIEDDDMYTEMVNYDMNYTVKQLLLICDYYGLMKDVKTNKMKKQDVIEQILLFENNIENYEDVVRRKELWYYINELKNDKMMKKFVIWN
jgi:hypothetical protein